MFRYHLKNKKGNLHHFTSSRRITLTNILTVSASAINTVLLWTKKKKQTKR